MRALKNGISILLATMLILHSASYIYAEEVGAEVNTTAAISVPEVDNTQTGIYNGFSYELDTITNEITITGYTGTDSNITIPGTIDGHTVTTIGYSAFYCNTTITDVVIDPGITTIDIRGFSKCTNLTSITFPTSLKSISRYAFEFCNGLTNVTIPDGTQTIAKGTFSGCINLKKITIPGSVTTMESDVDIFEGINNMQLIIYGDPGSAAQTYASDLGYGFRDRSVIPATGISIAEGYEISIAKGSTYQLHASVLPSNSTFKNITGYFYDNTNIGTVNNSGLVTAYNVGDFTAYAYLSMNQGGYTDMVKGSTITFHVYDPNTYADSVNISESNIRIDAASSSSYQLSATVLPENTTNKMVTWSDDSNCIGVDSTGKISVYKNYFPSGFFYTPNELTAPVTATTTNGKKATCTVTLYNDDYTLDANSCDIGEYNLNLKVGDSYTFTPSAAPIQMLNSIYYTCSTNGIIGIKGNTVTALKTGTTWISMYGLSTANGECLINVTEDPNAATAVYLSQFALSLETGKSAALTASLSPSTSTNTITWSSDNTAVVTVNNGQVYGIKDGTATIKATASSGVSSECIVTVHTPVPAITPSITLNKTNITLVKGQESTDLKVSNIVSSSSNKTFISSNTGVVAVDSCTGRLTAVHAGTAVITVRNVEGSTDTCYVTVENSRIKLNATSISVQRGKATTALKLSENLYPNDQVKSVESSDKNKITATYKNGAIYLKGLKASSKAITITIKMKSGATATCKVKVQNGTVKTDKLKQSATKKTLKKGKRYTLSISRTPITANDKITYQTSNKKIATVDSKGKITAKKKGTCTITVKSASGKTAKCKITVR